MSPVRSHSADQPNSLIRATVGLNAEEMPGRRTSRQLADSASDVSDVPLTGTRRRHASEGGTGRVVVAIGDVGQKIEKALQSRANEFSWKDLPRMNEIKFEYPEIDEFLHQIESYVQVQGSNRDLAPVVLRQMAATVRDYYLEHYLREYGEEPIQYSKLVKIMGALTNVRDPEEYLEEALEAIKPGSLTPQAVRVAMSKAIATYRRMCRRLNQAPELATPGRIMRRYLKLLRADIRKQLIPIVSQPGYEDLARVEKIATQIYNAQLEIEEERREKKRAAFGEDRFNPLRKRMVRYDETGGSPPYTGAVLRPRPAFDNGRGRNFPGNYRRGVPPPMEAKPGEWTVNAAMQTPPPRLTPNPNYTPGAPPPPMRPNTIGSIVCFSCGERNHGLRDCPKFTAECKADPERWKRCAGCNSTGRCEPSCKRRMYFVNMPGEYVELMRYG